MSRKRYEGPERRKYFRYKVIYAPKHKARLVINGREFTVLDFSEGGLRFAKDRKTKIDHHVRGRLIYADGKTRQIDGEIVWDHDTEAGLQYV